MDSFDKWIAFGFGVSGFALILLTVFLFTQDASLHEKFYNEHPECRVMQCVKVVDE